MPTHEIWDTNIFRYIGAGDLTLADVQQAGLTTTYSPATLLELSSRYTAESFEHRKRAAQAILDSGARLLSDPESYLARDVFGFTLNEPEFDWTHAAHVMAQSNSLEELQNGVPDLRARVRRSANISFAQAYRDGQDREFIEDMLSFQRRMIPGFAEWWNPDPLQRQGQAPRLTGAAREAYVAATRLPQYVAGIVEDCRDRALYKTDEPLPWPPTTEWAERLAAATERLRFYIAVVTQYCIRLLTAGMLPNENDWFDLDILLYSRHDDHVVVTSERKWESIANDAAMPQRLRRVRP